MSIFVESKKWLQTWIVPWFVGGAVFFLVASTASHYGLAWDEPNYFHASDLEIRWLVGFGKNLLKGEAAKSLKDDVIEAAWHWDPYHVPHPPFSRIISGLTKTFFSPFIDKFTAYRLAPALFFALLVTVMYLWMAEIFDRATAIFSAITLVLTPNLFGFAHFAVTDMPLAAMWFVTVYCFWRGLTDWKWSVVLGIVWGFALATKFPALLIPMPLLLWAHLYHRKTYTNNVFAMIFLSPLVMIASQPYLWHQTFLRILEFLYEGVSRGYRPETNYTILFYNKLLFTNELPRYYPFFAIAVTTPETILIFFSLGVISTFWLKARRDVLLLFLFNTLFIPTLGLLPGAVLHDGVRQLLSALPFLAALAGTGFFFLVESSTCWAQTKARLGKIGHLRAKLAAAVSFIALFPSSVDLFAYHPYELSYYNRLVGGIRGAYHRGLEMTYFMEAFTPNFLDRLNRSMPPAAVINSSFSNSMFEYYQKENRLRRDIKLTDGKDFDYYILLNRKSAFSQIDWAFLATRPPLYDAFRLDGAPLISIYKIRDRGQ